MSNLFNQLWQSRVFNLLIVGTTAFFFSISQGQEKATYTLVEDWPQVPAGFEWNQVPNVTIDSEGYIYAFQRDNPPVLKFDQSGKLVDTWGDGFFDRPHGFRITPDGYVFATDYGQNAQQVYKFTLDGELLMTLGRKGSTGSGTNTFNGPADVAVAANGDFFVADGHRNTRVVKFNKDGEFIKAWGQAGSGPGELDVPHSIVIDRRGRVLVADRSNHRIQIFDQEGNFIDEWDQFGWPSGLYIDKNDVLYVADYQDKFGITYGSAEDGTVYGFIDGVEPEGVVVDDDGNVYAGEVGGRSFKKFKKN